MYNLNPKICISSKFNPYPAKLNNLNFQLPEVVARYRDPQLQVAENPCYLLNFTPNICKS